MVKILIGNVTSKIIGHLPDDVQDELHKVLAYRVANCEFSPAFKNKRWDGYIRLYYRHKAQSFYTGLMAFVVTTLQKHKVEYQIEDPRIVAEKNLPNLVFSPLPNQQERDYQEFTINRAIEKTRGVLKIATGGGKTHCANKIIAGIKTSPFMFYVLTKDLMEQAYDAFSSTLNEPIGRIGGGRCDIQNINVCTIQTAVRAINHDNKTFKISDYLFDEEDKDIWDEDQLDNNEKYSNIQKLVVATKGLMVDECHHVSCKSVLDVLNASPNAYWRYGCSATPYREDNADIVIQAMFGKKIVDISASYLIDKGFLLTPYIIFEKIQDNCTLHSYPSIYSSCISHNEAFNRHIASIANHMISKELSTLVLVRQYAHGDYLKTLIPNTKFVTGRMTSRQREEAIEELRSKKALCMIATCLADEGLDIPTLDAAILAGGGSSATRMFQRVGRTLRKVKGSSRTKSVVIYPEHDSRHLKDHAKKARKILKEEPKFQIVNSRGGDFIYNEIDEIMELGDRTKTIFDL